MAATGAPETQKGCRGVQGCARSRPRGASGPWGVSPGYTRMCFFLLPTDTLNASLRISTFQCVSTLECAPPTDEGLSQLGGLGGTGAPASQREPWNFWYTSPNIQHGARSTGRIFPLLPVPLALGLRLRAQTKYGRRHQSFTQNDFPNQNPRCDVTAS